MLYARYEEFSNTIRKVPENYCLIAWENETFSHEEGRMLGGDLKKPIYDTDAATIRFRPACQRAYEWFLLCGSTDKNILAKIVSEELKKSVTGTYMDMLMKRSLSSMIYFLLRYPLEDHVEINNGAFSNNVYEEMTSWLQFFSDAVSDYKYLDIPEEKLPEFVRNIIEIIKEELKEGIYFEKVSPETYFAMLESFINGCTGSDTALEFIKNIYTSCSSTFKITVNDKEYTVLKVVPAQHFKNHHYVYISNREAVLLEHLDEYTQKRIMQEYNVA